ncbi:MAG TPA: LytTR family DNA-binding domain-containing protein [Candidatus Acidoferrales bacterium]|nr:LytTR family DNA-binding domain-containing protein [Candidatus Acidoferrales bacterium]
MKKNITAILVDDEPLARKLVKEYLLDFPAIRVIGECKNGRQAIKAINECKPDLMFLDIRMPGMDGFEVLEHLDHLPRIIFTTAYGDYALKAFEMNAVDYLLKPYDRKRFSRAIHKVLDRNLRAGDEIERIVAMLQHTKLHEGYPACIFVRVGRKIVSVQLSDIAWIEADGDYSQLHTAGGTHLCNLSLNALERRLDRSRFLRVHRSYIIASNSIEHLAGDGEGGYIALLKDKSRVKISRTYAAKIRQYIW